MKMELIAMISLMTFLVMINYWINVLNTILFSKTYSYLVLCTYFLPSILIYYNRGGEECGVLV